MVYIDTSAFLAVLDKDDDNHENSKKKWISILDSKEKLICSSYVLVETCALLQSRLGIEALRAFHDDIIPILDIKWIDDYVHNIGMNAVLAANRRQLSLVDCVSFAVMRRLGIDKVFTLDSHFFEQSFKSV
jgi:uncharacterized protein